MTPEEARFIRLELGLSMSKMADMLGYEGIHAKHQVNKMETGARPIRGAQERLYRAYESGYRPDDWPG